MHDTEMNFTIGVVLTCVLYSCKCSPVQHRFGKVKEKEYRVVKGNRTLT